MNQATLGLKYLAAIVDAADLKPLTAAGDMSGFFRPNEEPVYTFIKEFAAAHGKIPSDVTVEAHTGVELPEVAEPHTYYLKEVEKRFTEKSIRDAVADASKLLKPGKSKDPEAALAVLTSSLSNIHLAKNASRVLDFRDAHDKILTDYTCAALSETIQGVCLGWPYLDNMIGGLQGGDLVSIIGRPAVGKTWKMVYCANHAWETQFLTPLVVSMEVALKPLLRRQAALFGHIPSTGLKMGELTTKAMVKLEDSLLIAQAYEVPYWIADGSMSASVDDVHLLAQRLKPDVIYVDGAYLMKHPGRFATKYQRVGAVAEDLKTMASDLDIPVVASWQFNRNVGKKKKNKEAITIDDIAFADEIGQISSIVLGLFQDETPETLTSRIIDVLKGREGEQGRFMTNWLFDTMNFSQLDVQPKGKLEYM